MNRIINFLKLISTVLFLLTLQSVSYGQSLKDQYQQQENNDANQTDIRVKKLNKILDEEVELLDMVYSIYPKPKGFIIVFDNVPYSCEPFADRDYGYLLNIGGNAIYQIIPQYHERKNKSGKDVLPSIVKVGNILKDGSLQLKYSYKNSPKGSCFIQLENIDFYNNDNGPRTFYYRHGSKVLKGSWRVDQHFSARAVFRFFDMLNSILEYDSPEQDYKSNILKIFSDQRELCLWSVRSSGWTRNDIFCK